MYTAILRSFYSTSIGLRSRFWFDIAESHPDIILQDTLINLGIHPFSLYLWRRSDHISWQKHDNLCWKPENCKWLTYISCHCVYKIYSPVEYAKKLSRTPTNALFPPVWVMFPSFYSFYYFYDDFLKSETKYLKCVRNIYCVLNSSYSRSNKEICCINTTWWF